MTEIDRGAFEYCDKLVSVGDQCSVAGDLGEAFCILLGKCGHLADGGIFFQNDLTLPVGKDFKGVTFPDA